jgi:hypothetical protein
LTTWLPIASQLHASRTRSASACTACSRAAAAIVRARARSAWSVPEAAKPVMGRDARRLTVVVGVCVGVGVVAAAAAAL